MSYLVTKFPACFSRLSAILMLLVSLAAGITLPVAAVSHNSQISKPVLRYDISGSSAWYPYFIPNSQKPGIVTELVAAVLTEADIEGQQVAMPPKRTLVALDRGELDFDVISPSWFSGNKVPEGFTLSDGLIEIKEYVVTLPKNALRFQHTSALKKIKISVL